MSERRNPAVDETRPRELAKIPAGHIMLSDDVMNTPLLHDVVLQNGAKLTVRIPIPENFLRLHEAGEVLRFNTRSKLGQLGLDPFRFRIENGFYIVQLENHSLHTLTAEVGDEIKLGQFYVLGAPQKGAELRTIARHITAGERQLDLQGNELIIPIAHQLHQLESYKEIDLRHLPRGTARGDIHSALGVGVNGHGPTFQSAVNLSETEPLHVPSGVVLLITDGFDPGGGRVPHTESRVLKPGENTVIAETFGRISAFGVNVYRILEAA